MLIGISDEEYKEHVEIINNMTHFEMARLWRFAPPGHKYFDPKLPLWKHFDSRFKALGGFNPQISKALGWER